VWRCALCVHVVRSHAVGMRGPECSVEMWIGSGTDHESDFDSASRVLAFNDRFNCRCADDELQASPNRRVRVQRRIPSAITS
jgi:hypothetical protein